MAESLSRPSSAGVIDLANDALRATQLVSAVHSHPTSGRGSQSIRDLQNMLISLLCVARVRSADFDSLKATLARCGNVCKEYGESLSGTSKKSPQNRTIDSANQLALYKSIIELAMIEAGL